MNYFIDLKKNIAQALSEDINTGDITANLIKKDAIATATVIVKESAIVCGRPWFDEVFQTLDDCVSITWFCEEGEAVSPMQKICQISGDARAILTAERSALNFLQTLSATATIVNKYVKHLYCNQLDTKILDTRKTLPGLRLAQKYAVKCGGGCNHRIGLYDAILIKENHILSCGGIWQTVHKAQELYPDIPIEIEVETMQELIIAMDNKVAIIMLDNFSLLEIERAVKLVQQQKSNVKLEVSGNIEYTNILEIARTGIDYISIGALTKNIQATDYSMRFVIEHKK